MSASMEACIARHAALPSPPLLAPSLPLPLPSPLTTSSTDTGAPLGYRAAGIRMRVLLASTSRRTDIRKADMPPQKKACLTTLAPRFDIGESSVAVDKTMEIALTTLEGVNERVIELDTTVSQRTDECEVCFEDAQYDRALLRARVNTLFRDRPDHHRTAMFMDREAMYSREAWAFSIDRTSAIAAHVRTLETQVLEARDLEPQEGPAKAGRSCVAAALTERDADMSKNGDNSNDSGTGGRSKMTTPRECSYAEFLKCQPMSFQGTEGVVGLTRWIEKMELVLQINKCTVACQVKFTSRTLQGSALTWWNSHMRAVGHDVVYAMSWAALKMIITSLDLLNYNHRFQELALMCKRMFSEEVEKKLDDTSRNNQHQQQPFKRNNVARAYTNGPRDKKPCGGIKPLCPKCNYHHDGPCTHKCTNCRKIGHWACDCKSQPTANNNNNNHQRAQGANARGITCFECGVQGHYKSECPKLKNGNQQNRAGNGNAVAKAYAVGTAGTNPNSNVVTDHGYDVELADVLIDTKPKFISTSLGTMFFLAQGTVSVLPMLLNLFNSFSSSFLLLFRFDKLYLSNTRASSFFLTTFGSSSIDLALQFSTTGLLTNSSKPVKDKSGFGCMKFPM
nr:hypothetical protein [Tanacetum cinerariifolium]